MEEEFASYKEKQAYFRNKNKETKVFYKASKQPYNKRREHLKRMKLNAMVKQIIKDREHAKEPV